MKPKKVFLAGIATLTLLALTLLPLKKGGAVAAPNPIPHRQLI